ncbi:hypothetical protein BDV59DRAFT_112683 [Aspergillus ambiguus]|uniref:uncharacterized protein n=1 Tax=Aspergillus ambiguus TaxID=176160 RepID=UPI003CCD9C92
MVANGGVMDFEKWPGMVEPLIERLEYIVYNVFPMPEVPPETTAVPISNEQQPQQQDASFSNPVSSFLQEPNPIPPSSNKENTSPVELQTPSRPTASSTVAPPPSSSFDRVPDSQPQSDTTNGAGPEPTLPAPLMLLFDSTRSTLRSLFSTKPPHTIQRLAELIIRPNAHYRTLPAYLRAVDRVVSVTSSADVFPLQPQPAQPNGVAPNGAESGSFMLPDHGMGGDESLGGALLTPIPWLNNAASPSATAATTGGVAEGLETMTAQPLEEMEHSPQQAPIVQAPPPAGTVENQAMEGSKSPPVEASEDVPHARGPQIIGVEDMGLQDGHGVEMTLSNPEEGSGQQQSEEGQQPAPKESDGDGDIQLAGGPAESK